MASRRCSPGALHGIQPVGLQQRLGGFRGGGIGIGLPEEEEEEAAHQADDGEGDEHRLTVLVWRHAAQISGFKRLKLATTETLPTCDVNVSTPGAVDVEVSEEQAAVKTKDVCEIANPKL